MFASRRFKWAMFVFLPLPRLGRVLPHITNLIQMQPVTKALEFQREHTSVTVVDGVPFARLSPEFAFEEVAETVDGTEPQDVHEKLVWSLASCLFDPLDSAQIANVDETTEGYMNSRIRKDRFSSFWTKLVQEPAMQQVHLATTREEEAIAYLSGHQIADACGSLIEGRDFRLATLVAMIGGDQSMRQDMQEQLLTWRRSRVLPEMSEPIRALYELLAGNTCTCDGSVGPLEDRARTFFLSDRFKLNWKQALGLRLWYGIREEEPLQNAVRMYLDDININKEEHSRPVPWFVEEEIMPVWDDPHKDQAEDLLFGLLKVFSDYIEQKTEFALEDILVPQNHQTSPIEFRLAWQLYQTLQKAQIADFRSEGVDADGIEQPSPKIDQLTLDFAWQLETAGHWLWAMFVSLHLLDSKSRMCAVQGLLARHGGEIGNANKGTGTGAGASADEESSTFKALAEKFMLPRPWLWEAQALHARSVARNHVVEIEYLLRASNWEAAHKTLVEVVAPDAIIGEDLAVLERLLDGFKQVDRIEKWSSGGQVYVDYLHLLKLTRSSTEASHGLAKQVDEDGDRRMIEEEENEDENERNKKKKTTKKKKGNGVSRNGLPTANDLVAVLSRLLQALPTWSNKNHSSPLGFRQRVAAHEMSATVAKVVLNMSEELGSVSFDLSIFPLTHSLFFPLISHGFLLPSLVFLFPHPKTIDWSTQSLLSSLPRQQPSFLAQPPSLREEGVGESGNEKMRS